jgi:hypothetical protein
MVLLGSSAEIVLCSRDPGTMEDQNNIDDEFHSNARLERSGKPGVPHPLESGGEGAKGCPGSLRIKASTIERWKRMIARGDAAGGIHSLLWADIESWRARGGDPE